MSSTPTITIQIKRPHQAQRRIHREARRFNVVACGRRFGKTTLLEDAAIRPALEGYPVGWFAPNYKYLMEAWRDLDRALSPIMLRRNTAERRMELMTGGVLEFWSMEHGDAGRSRKYKRIIVDEGGLIRNLLSAWHADIRATLADYAGDAWIAGTPKGHNDFYTLWGLGSTDRNWQHWRMPSEANPYIPRSEILDMRESMPALIVEQEIDAAFTAGALNLFTIEDIDRASESYDAPEGGQWMTAVDIGRRRDATVINTFDISQKPYRRVAFERLERVPYPYIQKQIEDHARRYPGQLVIESNGVGDPVIENLNVYAQPFYTSARSKLQAIQALQLLMERGDIQAAWDGRERQALIDGAWDNDHTADEIMSLAILAHSIQTMGTPGI